MKASLFHGLLVVDKPGGMTSRDAVDRAQGWFPRGTRLGHTGTLDPLATGVLVLTLGSATRLADYVQRMAKTYRTTIRLGATSDSDDADGNITPNVVEQPPERAVVDQVVREFVGAIDQVPPAYSAAKVDGRRAYALARRGHEVVLKPRTVCIHAIDVLAYDYPVLELEVRCGKGTYIRSLARDVGKRLGCGGYVEVLRRTHVGPFAAADGLGLDADVATARSRLLPLAAAVCELSRLAASAADVARLRQGRSVSLAGCTRLTDHMTMDVAVMDNKAQLVAVVKADWIRGVLSPVKVFAATESG